MSPEVVPEVVLRARVLCAEASSLRTGSPGWRSVKGRSAGAVFFFASGASFGINSHRSPKYQGRHLKTGGNERDASVHAEF